MIYATGEKNFDSVKSQIKDLSKVELLPYINNMPYMYSRVSLVVARAGALTISELEAAGMPGILIPLPTAAENHQEYNARAFEKSGGGVMLLEKDLNAKKLNYLIVKMLKDKKKLLDIKKENADEKIFRMIRPYLEK